MTVCAFSEADQSAVLEEYNAGHQSPHKIPLVLRNYHTGWPLLQVSLFSISQQATYEHVLGGGTCHFFFVGAFNFASLLTKIPGKMLVLNEDRIEVAKERVKADNVPMFLEEFSIYHQSIGVKISSESGGYGKILNVKIPVGNSKKLEAALDDSFSFALRPHAKLTCIVGWKDSPGYTGQHIRNEINPQVATFSNGQIFIDLEAFFNHAVQDLETAEFFKCLFKVEEFLQLKKTHPDFKPISPDVDLIDELLKVTPIAIDAAVPADKEPDPRTKKPNIPASDKPHKKKFSWRESLFFGKTGSKKKPEDIEKALSSTPIL